MTDRTEKIPVTRSSGNVFADLGLPNPEERLAKAHLALEIGRILKQRKLTQHAAAKLMGVDQPKVSHLLHGRLSGFSTERLMGFLTALGRHRDRRPNAASAPPGPPPGSGRLTDPELASGPQVDSTANRKSWPSVRVDGMYVGGRLSRIHVFSTDGPAARSGRGKDRVVR